MGREIRRVPENWEHPTNEKGYLKPLMADNQLTIKEYLAAPAVQKRVEEMLDKRSSQFTTSVLALASSDPQLMAAEPRSLFNACLVAASLNLPINKNLGFAHIIPYNNTKKGIVEAQYQMGWKGFVQLAQRTGQYRTISATPVYEGQLVSADPLRGNTYDWTRKMSDKIVGYVSIIILNNGFEHQLYMSAEEMEAHGKRYSQSYKKNYGPWKDNFPAMAEKTVIKLNVSKYGPLSVDMEKALMSDQAVLRGDDAKPEYIDGTDLLEDEKATAEQKDAIVAEFTSGEEVEMTEAERDQVEANGNPS
ncbi:MAG TPA: recombinase RecT [Ktedonobacteraceae bacterium]|jgi:recombination protein RecT|nr:recombinase RecT [Ktedonobacteraceae bacterium]